MAGSRPLTRSEERSLVRHIRRLHARDHALITAQLFLGFRISEILSLTIGHVLDRGRFRVRVALPPRFLKGGYEKHERFPSARNFAAPLSAIFDDAHATMSSGPTILSS